MSINEGDNRKILKSCIALAIGIIFALVISEIILQIFDFPRRPISGWLNCNIKNPGECNSLGFRGSEIKYADDDYVVVLLGDSEVYAASFPFEQMPECRLEYFLKKFKKKVKVFTVGDMGYGQDQQYLALKRYFEKYRADMVVLMFTARNDIENNMFPVAGGNNTLKPTFWLENGVLHGPTEEWLEPAGTKIKLSLILESFIGKTISDLRLEKWKKNILPQPYKPFDHYEGEVDYSWHEGWKTAPEEALKGIDYEMIEQGNNLTPQSEMRQYGIDLTRKIFYELKKLSEDNNGHFIIFKEERSWEINNKDEEKIYFLNGKYYKLSMRQYHDNLKALFQGYEYYSIPLNIDNDTVSSDNHHLSHQSIDKLFGELSLIISSKEYFKKE